MNRRPAGLLHINNEGWAEALTCSGLHLGGVYSERVDAGALSRPCTKPKVSCGMPELTIHYVSLPSWHLTEADTVHRLMKWKTYRPKIFMVCSGSQRAVSACELNSPLLIWFSVCGVLFPVERIILPAYDDIHWTNTWYIVTYDIRTLRGHGPKQDVVI